MQQDEDQKLRTMYRDFGPILRTIAKNQGVSVDDIDDMIQETYLAYYLKYPLDWNEKQKKAMLVRILKNKCIDLFRRRSHYDMVSMDTEEPFDETKIVANKNTKDVLETLATDETLREIRKEIQEMKKDWRDVVVLYFIEERPIEDICLILEISEPALRMRISRIRKYFRDVFK